MSEYSRKSRKLGSENSEQRSRMACAENREQRSWAARKLKPNLYVIRPSEWVVLSSNYHILTCSTQPQICRFTTKISREWVKSQSTNLSSIKAVVGTGNECCLADRDEASPGWGPTRRPRSQSRDDGMGPKDYASPASHHL